METRIWSKSEDKWAYILVLRGRDMHHVKITGSLLTIEGKTRLALEALERGEEPASLHAKSVETIDVTTITRAELSPGNDTLTVHGGPDGSESISYSTPDDDADAILGEILAQSEKTFQPRQEGISAIEAILPPAFIGLLGGLGWLALFDSAVKMAAGRAAEDKGLHRRAFRRMLLRVVEFLGSSGMVALGIVVLVLVVVWTARRLIFRPERTVWLPDPA